jgi:hypothetical protein
VPVTPLRTPVRPTIVRSSPSPLLVKVTEKSCPFVALRILLATPLLTVSICLSFLILIVLLAIYGLSLITAMIVAKIRITIIAVPVSSTLSPTVAE